MIKLKNILREVGLLGEQANSQLITVTDTDTKQTIQDKLNSVDRSKPVNLQLGTSITLNNDAIPTDTDKQNVINQIKLLQSISATPLVATVNGTTSKPPASANAPGAILTPETATAFERWVNDNNNTPNNRIQMTSGSSNNNLAIRRAAAMAEVAADAGISSANIRIGNVNTNTQRTASITVTGSFPIEVFEKFTFDVAVRIPNDTEMRSGKLYTIPLYKKQYEKRTPGKWVNEKSQANFKSFVSKLAKRTNPGLTPEQFKTVDPAVFDKFATLNNLISNIDIIDYLRTNRDTLLQKPFLQKWNQDKAAIGIDNVIKLFSK